MGRALTDSRSIKLRPPANQSPTLPKEEKKPSRYLKKMVTILVEEPQPHVHDPLKTLVLPHVHDPAVHRRLIHARQRFPQLHFSPLL